MLLHGEQRSLHGHARGTQVKKLLVDLILVKFATTVADGIELFQNVEFMRTFGNVHREMMEWFIVNKPDLAQEWLDKLESIRWKNYLTPEEAEKIVAGMKPDAPWPRDKWNAAMAQHGFDTEREPAYNSCALWTEMNKIMSDSSDTIAKYIEEDKLFEFIYSLAVDNLTDKDGVYNIRTYFGL